MILLGIDPGTATTGYGLIEVDKENNLSLIEFGKIATKKDFLMEQRLHQIFNSLEHLIDKFSPDVMVVEKLFFNTNVKTAMTVGQARGIYLLSAGIHKLRVFEYTALEAKKILTGYGRAEKDDVRCVVKQRLLIKTDIKPIDASDALAIVLCHIDKCGLIGDINDI